MMFTYEDWNKAILTYVLADKDAGTAVYLAVDDDVIAELGYGLSDGAEQDWTEDFLQAVQQKCIQREQVYMNILMPRAHDEIPHYLAFLALTVLAATRMSGDEDVHSTNYFVHLNELLGLAQRHGRPRGLEGEALLWEQWNQFLRTKGFIPTAKAGEASYKYINYPISQTLLREADKEGLWRYFSSRSWSPHLDKETVFVRLRRGADHLNKHLQFLLQSQATDILVRQEALQDAVFDVYESWGEAGETQRSYRRGRVRKHRHLTAVLYRTEDPFSGTCTYHLFPRQNRHLSLPTQATIHHNETEYTLQAERTGWYRPLWALSAEALNKGLAAIVKADKAYKLVLPQRDFWLITADPHDPHSSPTAAWGRGVQLGERFTLLCRQTLAADIQYLRDEKLIQWESGKPIPLANYPGWQEYRHVMVVSEGWAGINIANEDLLETLRPHTTLHISLSGGLRSPNGGWFWGYLPTLTIYSFYNRAKFRIRRLDGAEISELQEIPTNEPVSLEALMPGQYDIEVSAGEMSTERSLSIVDWHEDVFLPIPETKDLQSEYPYSLRFKV